MTTTPLTDEVLLDLAERAAAARDVLLEDRQQVLVDVDALEELIKRSRWADSLLGLATKLVRKLPVDTHLMLLADEAGAYDTICQAIAAQPAPTAGAVTS